MRTRILFIVLVAFYSVGPAQLPVLNTAFKIGSTQYDNGDAIAVDATGKVWVTGYFENTADFNPGAGTNNLTSGGLHDIFFANYDASGNYLWAWRVGGSGYDQGTGVTVDAAGNSYFCGYFAGNVDFNPGAGTTNLVSSGGDDVFLTKYNSAGVFQWAIKIGGSNYDMSHAVACDASGNVYITGFFGGTVDFDPGAGTANITSTGAFDMYLAKYNTAGAYQWAFKVGSNISDEFGYDVAVDASNFVLVTGSFAGTVDFDPGAGTVTRTNVSGNDFFVAKYSPAMVFQWVATGGAASTDDGTSVETDAAGNVFLGGGFESTVDFDPGPGVVNMTSAGSLDLFLAKYNSAGTLQWAKRAGSTGADYVQKLAIDGAGNPLLTGYFNQTVDFDLNAGVANLTSAGGYESFVARYDANGNYLWAFRLGATAFDMGYDIDLNDNCQLAITGYFEGTTDFDPNAGIFNLSSTGGFDAYIGLYGNCLSPLADEGQFSLVPQGESVYLNWQNPPQEAAKYLVQRKTGNDFLLLAEINKNQPSPAQVTFTDTQMQPGKNYYRMGGVNHAGEITWTEVLMAENFSGALVIYPNPVQTGFHFLLPAGETASQLSLYDLTGREVIISFSEGEVQLPSHLSAGYYQLRIQTVSGKSFTSPLLIQDSGQ